VGAIEGIIEMASLRPFESKWRIFIIMDAERMRGPAQNHLLKTLEEPLGQTLFILITEFPQLLLPTIRSRCQRLRFGALRPDTVLDILRRKRNLPPEAAQAAASLSQGQMSRAFDLVDTERRTVVLDMVGRLSAGEDPLALSEEFGKYLSAQKAAIEAGVKAEGEPPDNQEVSKEDREQIKEELMALADALCRRDIMEHLYLFETWYRDALVYRATGGAIHILNLDQEALLKSAGPPGDPIGAIGKARLYLERFLNEERVFRDLFFALAP
jgi:DNA polymerase III delta prime subunit